MKKLKIGFDAKRLFHNNTGLGNYARTLVKNLHQFYPEHEYHLFTSEISSNENCKYFLSNNFLIHTKPKWSNAAIWRTIGVSKKINELGLDIFHGLSHELPYNIGLQTKTVVTIHDLIYEKNPELFPLIDGWFYKIKYKSACERADAIIAISQSTAKDIEEVYKIKNKVKCLYQTCSEVFQTTPIIDSPKKHFLYVGSINERKGLLKIVQAYGLLEEKYQLPFVVIGEGGDYKTQVLAEIKTFGLSDKFIFKGNVNNDELVNYYDESLCLVLPSLYEGFGIPIIESLFRHRPVITSNVSSLPEACGLGGITFDPNSITALKTALEAMHSPEKWRQYSSNGHGYVAKKFNQSTTTKLIMDFYNEIISK